MRQRFQTTRWSLIYAARADDGVESRRALSSLCEAYWSPLYFYVRRQGHDAEAARDLTQAYFLTFLEKDYLSDVERDGGRFRSFLLASLKHFLSKERDRHRAAKRGGGRVPLPIDAAEVEARFLSDRVAGDSPEAAFERQWARTMLDRTMARLESEFAEAGKRDQLECLRGHLTGEVEAAAYVDVAERLGTSVGAVRVAVHRARRRFGELLRDEIAQTVAHPDDVDVGVRQLLEVLRR